MSIWGIGMGIGTQFLGYLGILSNWVTKLVIFVYKALNITYTGIVSNAVVCVIGTFSSQLKVCHNKMLIFYLFLVQQSLFFFSVLLV
jgi:hypothetical protein